MALRGVVPSNVLGPQQGVASLFQAPNFLGSRGDLYAQCGMVSSPINQAVVQIYACPPPLCV